MKYLVVACLIIFNLQTRAQDRVITGRLLDKTTQQPIENANITVQGTTSGSVSDSLGVFQITLRPNYKVLIISHVSYQDVSMQIPDAERFKIELEKIYFLLPTVDLTYRPPELAPLQLANTGRNNTVARELEQNAGFYGGTEYLNYYLTTHYKFPAALRSSLKGKLYVSFLVDTTGAIENVKIHDDSLNTALRDQILHLFSSMPTWRPAYQNGNPVRQKILVPIIYGPVFASDETDTYLSYYLTREITYPTEAVKLAVEGTVFIYFSLNAQQQFIRLEILQGIGSGCDQMVYNAIKSIPKAELKSLMAELGDSIFVLPVDFHFDQTSTREDQLLNSTDAVFLMPIKVVPSQPNNNVASNNMFAYPTTLFLSVEGALKHINYAYKLQIKDQELAVLSPEVGKLINLRSINLENNKLQSLPGALADLTNLEEFYAPRNSLSALPPGMSELYLLKTVGLSYNDFTEFPAALLNLKKLRTLDLSDNKISLVPSAISNMKKLRNLFLKNNKLEDLPEEFFKLKLDILNLEGNNLSDELKTKIKESFKNAKVTL